MKGFSLIELMVAVAILGILAAIAVPAYQASVRKSRRTEARTALLDLAGREEKFNSATNTYSQDFTQLGWAADLHPMPLGSGNYTIDVKVVTPKAGSGLPYTYLLTVVPAGGSDQINDTPCQKFTVDQLGTQLSTDGAADTTATCWH